MARSRGPFPLRQLQGTLLAAAKRARDIVLAVSKIYALSVFVIRTEHNVEVARTMLESSSDTSNIASTFVSKGCFDILNFRSASVL